VQRSRRASRSAERGFCLPDDRLERRRLANREIGQDLAIYHDPRPAEADDQAAVRHAERANGCIEPLDPQCAEGPLAALAVPIGILLRALDCLLGDADRVLAAAVIALRGFEDLLVL